MDMTNSSQIHQEKKTKQDRSKERPDVSLNQQSKQNEYALLLAQLMKKNKRMQGSSTLYF